MADAAKNKDERATILADRALELAAAGKAEVEGFLPSDADNSH